MPKLMFCGDPHGKFNQILRSAEKHRPDGVILLGDNLGESHSTLTLQEELQAIWDCTWFIHGNHETDFESTTRLMLADSAKNLHGRVLDIAGVKIAGLGGVFRGQIWMPGQDPKYRSYQEYKAAADAKRPPRIRHESHAEDRKHLSSIFIDECESLARLNADILVTHEACSAHQYGFTAIEDLARSMEVKFHFHGHLHENIDYSEHAGRLGFLSRGVAIRDCFILEL